jgi:hypothetical protein
MVAETAMQSSGMKHLHFLLLVALFAPTPKQCTTQINVIKIVISYSFATVKSLIMI